MPIPYPLNSKGYGGSSGSGLVGYSTIPSTSPYLPGVLSSSSLMFGRHDFPTPGRSPLYGGGSLSVGSGLNSLGFSAYSIPSPYAHVSPYAVVTSSSYGYGGYTPSSGPKSYYTPLPTISEHSSGNSGSGNKRRIPRTYIPVLPLPSSSGNRPALYTSSGVKTLFTEDIDVTTPRKTAKPGEISRDRGSDQAYGTIRRGRTVIRLETKKLKENPYLPQAEKRQEKVEKNEKTHEQVNGEAPLSPPLPNGDITPSAASNHIMNGDVKEEKDNNSEKAPQQITKDYSHVAKWYEEESKQPAKKEKNAGDKFREKYMVHSRKQKYSGYRRPTLSDIRAQKAVVMKEIEESLNKLTNSTSNCADGSYSAEVLQAEAEKLEKDKEKLAKLDKKIARRFSRALRKAEHAGGGESSDDESVLERMSTSKALRRSSSGTVKAASSDLFTSGELTQGPQRLTRKITKKFFFPQEASSVVQPEIIEALPHNEPQDAFEKNILAQRATQVKLRSVPKKVSQINQRKSSASDLEIPCDLKMGDITKVCDGDEIKEEMGVEPLPEIIEEVCSPVAKESPILNGSDDGGVNHQTNSIPSTPSGKKKKYVKKVGDPPAKRIPGNILQPIVVPPKESDSILESPTEDEIKQNEGCKNKKLNAGIGKVNGIIQGKQQGAPLKHPIVKNNVLAKQIENKIQEVKKQAATVGQLPSKKTEVVERNKAVGNDNKVETATKSNNLSKEAVKPAISVTEEKDVIKKEPEKASDPPKIIESQSNPGLVPSPSHVGKDTEATDKAFINIAKISNEQAKKSPLLNKLKPKLASDNKSASFDKPSPKHKLENKSSSLDGDAEKVDNKQTLSTDSAKFMNKKMDNQNVMQQKSNLLQKPVPVFNKLTNKNTPISADNKKDENATQGANDPKTGEKEKAFQLPKKDVQQEIKESLAVEQTNLNPVKILDDENNKKGLLELKTEANPVTSTTSGDGIKKIQPKKEEISLKQSQNVPLVKVPANEQNQIKKLELAKVEPKSKTEQQPSSDKSLLSENCAAPGQTKENDKKTKIEKESSSSIPNESKADPGEKQKGLLNTGHPLSPPKTEPVLADLKNKAETKSAQQPIKKAVNNIDKIISVDAPKSDKEDDKFENLSSPTEPAQQKAAALDSAKSETVKEKKISPQENQTKEVVAPVVKNPEETEKIVPSDDSLLNGHKSPPIVPKGKFAKRQQPAVPAATPAKQQPPKSPKPCETTQKEDASKTGKITTTAKVENVGVSTETPTNGPKNKKVENQKTENVEATIDTTSTASSDKVGKLSPSSEKSSGLDEHDKMMNAAAKNEDKLKEGNEADTLSKPAIVKRSSTHSSGSSISSSSSGSTAKSGSGSTSSTLSAGSSAGSGRVPSPPIEDDSDEERVALDKICPAKTRPKYRKYEIEDFQFLKVLGKGSFGKVLLAELKGSDSYFAIKCLKKDVVLEDDDVECTMIERKVLLMGSKHPYLCHLFCTFQTESHLFFVMEYLNGGDLMFHIQQSGRFTEERARFYGAEIVSGLKFLHKRGVIYRDLKLDNILLDYEGHIRIADFGMCKLQIYLDRMADTFCGTPDYMSPEIIRGLRYNQCVDWWAFGVLMYEMLIGQSPFSGHDEDELFWSICNEPVHYPRFLSKESKKLLELLLEKDASKRLGTAGCTNGDVKEQAFFQPIDWERLEKRDLEPPFVPKLKHSLDVQYFDTTFTKLNIRLTPVDKEILRSMDQTQFEGFSYTNPHTTD